MLLERVHQGNWLLIVRTPDKRLALRIGEAPGVHFAFGKANENIHGALRSLQRKMSPQMFRRFKDDRSFGALVLLEGVRALLNDDVDLTRGLLRRMVDTTLGFEQLAQITEGHPKSLVRMLGPNGNPSAKHLVAVIARLADAHRVRFRVALR